MHQKIRADKTVKKLNPYNTRWQKCKYSHSFRKKTLRQFLKKLNIELSYVSSNYFWAYPKELKAGLEQHCTPKDLAVLFILV